MAASGANCSACAVAVNPYLRPPVTSSVALGCILAYIRRPRTFAANARYVLVEQISRWSSRALNLIEKLQKGSCRQQACRCKLHFQQHCWAQRTTRSDTSPTCSPHHLLIKQRDEQVSQRLVAKNLSLLLTRCWKTRRWSSTEAVLDKSNSLLDVRNRAIQNSL